MKSNNCWVKYLTNNRFEVGSDNLIKEGKASWSRGNQTDIKKVVLYGFDKGISLDVPSTNWYQFDRFITDFSSNSNPSLLVYRAIQAQLTEYHLNNYICYNINKNTPNLLFVSNTKKGVLNTKILEEYINKWLTCLIYKEEIKIIITDKGTLNDYKSVFG